MPISIKIDPTAFDAGQPLEEFATRSNAPFANPPSSPSFNNPEGSTGAPQPGFIASAARLTFTTNILEDGTLPVAPAATVDATPDVIVHVSPTSGSTIIRGNNFEPSSAEFDPAYGLDVSVSGVELQEDVFETAINEPIGAQFKANLQDLVSRSILQVTDELGNILNANEIGAYVSSNS